MINKLKTIITSLTVLAVIAGTVAVFVPETTFAGTNAADEIITGANTSGLEGSRSLEDNIQLVTNILLFVIGAISVIVIIIGGVKFVTSDGDSGKIKSARETILYAVVGIVIALLAYAIVNFVVTQFI